VSTSTYQHPTSTDHRTVMHRQQNPLNVPILELRALVGLGRVRNFVGCWTSARTNALLVHRIICFLIIVPRQLLSSKLSLQHLLAALSSCGSPARGIDLFDYGRPRRWSIPLSFHFCQSLCHLWQCYAPSNIPLERKNWKKYSILSYLKMCEN